MTDTTAPRTYFIRTFGCQMNEHDSERAAGVLETMGYRPAPDAESAGLVLLNTCAIRENADNKLYGQLSHLKPLKLADPGKTIVVGGCLAQKDQQALADKAPYVDVVYGTHNMGSLPRLLAQADSASLPIVEILEHTEMFPSALPARREVAHHAWVSISIGCDNTCTFCIVPSLRGPEKSRKLGDIVTEVRQLVADGVTEVTLLGQNVNSYGRDLVRAGQEAALGGRTLFAELLHLLGDVEGLQRIRFTSPHPKDFTSDVFAAMRDVPSVCEQLHLPLQSGSDRILRRMQRSYRSRRFLDLVAEARETIPGLAISTDIIVGFPGETEEDFAATMAVAAQARFDSAFTFKYSRRPGTAAVDLDGHVEQAVMDERFLRLAELTRSLSEQSHRRQVGTVQEVLVEGPSKTDPTRVSGRTRQNRLVHVPASATTVPAATIAVAITDSQSHYLLGAETDAPVTGAVATPKPDTSTPAASLPATEHCRAPARRLGVITAVAVVPTTPLALEGLPGRQHPGVAAIGAAARRATADLAGVDLVIALAGGMALAVHAPPATDLRGYGLDLPPHALVGAPPAVVEAVRAALGDGMPGPRVVEPDLAVLARWAPSAAVCLGLVVPPDAPASLCAAIADAITDLAADRRVGLLVAGDLGAGHGPKPPRPGAASASAVLQDLAVAALDNGRPADLLRLDPGLAAASASRAVGALRVLGVVLQTARLGTVVRAADAPLGVGYVVAQGG